VNTPDEFDEMIGREFATETIDTTPYGTLTHPVKPGLTKRGKVALAIGTAVLATGGLLTWQHYSAVQAANEAKAQEIQLAKEKLELEKLKVLSETTRAGNTTSGPRQKQIDACVAHNKDLVGKTLGTDLQDIVTACQAQYTNPTIGPDMQEAAATTRSGGHDDGANGGLIIGGLVLAGGLALAVKKSTKSNPA
jgi:hypothetical protein